MRERFRDLLGGHLGKHLLHVGAACLLAWLALATLPGRARAQDFTVTASSTTDYTVNGQPDPALTLVRGRTYVFSVNTPGHPFYIKTAQVTGTASQFTDGVTGNGTTSGMLTFVVPLSAPSQLFYQCSVHLAMSGVINVVNAPAVPSAGPGGAALLALALCAIALYMPRNARARPRP